MSGGFFRGTSADQDTRFSNKQAKLLKTQKFAPELEHLVDMSKVKMDVIRPWIAKRVTELLGFEDEVLINFVYGLLDGKAVDGKQIQIQLTGFMEKNTAKFMRELWTLLISAQQNISGVPQQFLDAKEAEILQKKAENDKITQEIQNKREKELLEASDHNKFKGMDGVNDTMRSAPTAGSKRPSTRPEEAGDLDRKENYKSKRGEDKNSNRTSLSPSARRSSYSPKRHSGWSKEDRSTGILPSSPARRSLDSPKRHSRRSLERRRSRSISESPTRRRPIDSPKRPFVSRSPKRKNRSPPRTLSPRRRPSSPKPYSNRSPVRRRSPYRSPSMSKDRSRTPSRRRSPYIQRKSPSFVRHRSPPSFYRSRAYMAKRSRSPRRRRSPTPSRPVSPIKRKSASPVRRRPPSPDSPVRHRLRSPAKSPSSSPSVPHQSRSPKRQRGPPQNSSRGRAENLHSSPRERRSPRRPSHSGSPDIDRPSNGNRSDEVKNLHQRIRETRSSGNEDRSVMTGSRVARDHTSPISNRLHDEYMAIRDARGNTGSSSRRKSPDISQMQPGSYKPSGKSSRSRERSQSPIKKESKYLPRDNSVEASREEEEAHRAREDARRANSSRRRIREGPNDGITKDPDSNDLSPVRHSPYESTVHYSNNSEKLAKLEGEKPMEHRSGKGQEKHVSHRLHSSKESEHGHRGEKKGGDSYDNLQDVDQSVKARKGGSNNVPVEKEPFSDLEEKSESDIERISRKKSRRASEESDYIDDEDFPSGEYADKRKHKRSDRHKRHRDESSESDYELDDEARRRRKEEKKLRKEERRRRREERHKRKLERRAAKQKLKPIDTVTPPSDLDRVEDTRYQSDVGAAREAFAGSDREETESEQKRLEFELRERALESLRAKKAINN